MKKVFSILLGMTLMFSLVGCGATDTKSGVYAEDGYAESEMGDVMHT